MLTKKKECQYNCPDELVVERSIRDILATIGIPDTDAETMATPLRVAKAWTEMLRGYEEPDFTATSFPTKFKGMVVRKGIPFTSLCAHHMIPYSGTVDIGIIYNSRKLGISKIIRLIQWKCARLSSQEELTEELVDMFNKIIKPKGVMIIMSAFHGCEACRGVKVGNVPTITSWFSGVFKDTAPRAEFMTLISR